MIFLKTGVQIAGIKIEMQDALTVLEPLFRVISSGSPLVITSGTEGDHGDQSYHYNGLALDLRSKHLDLIDKEAFTRAMRVVLRSIHPAYFAFLEAEGTDNEHFHIEFNKPPAPFAKDRIK